jgi:hypothetical protein
MKTQKRLQLLLQALFLLCYCQARRLERLHVRIDSQYSYDSTIYSGVGL